MNMEYYLGMATTIQERAVLLNESAAQDQLNWLKKWRQRNTLLTEKEFKQSLNIQGLTPESFDCAVQPLSENDLLKLFTTVQGQEWYRTHQQLFTQELPLTDDLDSALRFHLAFCAHQFSQIIAAEPDITFSKQAQKEWLENLKTDWMFLAKKTLIWDVHDIIERAKLQAESKEAEFQLYLKTRFAKSADCKQFFEEYPVLEKLLITRSQFALKNLKLFLRALKEAQTDLQATWSIKPPYTVSHFKPGQGDSHCGGKTVVQIEVNHVPLIFKYKNLKIGESFNQLLSFIETLNPEVSFYKPARVYGHSFTFEEKITQSSCTTVQEIKQFYRRYGELLAVVYCLGSSDLHMENLIAKGSYPVLIDVETILTVELPAADKQNFSKKYLKSTASIMNSGLLPTKRKWEQDVELSALGGKRQKLSKKANKLANEKSSMIGFQQTDAYLDSSQNIPLLSGEPVDYRDYTTQLLTGFQSLSHLLMQHKNELLDVIMSNFPQREIRILLRDTASYANLLEFATHPSCMTNYPEREKILENLWHSRYVLPVAIPNEISAMQTHDIPFFTVSTTGKNLCWQEHSLTNYFTETPLQSVCQRINKLNESALQLAELEIKESLGLVQFTLNRYPIPVNNPNLHDPLLQRAADIGDFVLTQLTLDEEQQKIYFLNCELDEAGQPRLTYPEQELYQGTVGLYLFYLYLNHYCPKHDYSQLLKLLEKEIFSIAPALQEVDGLFFGLGARLLAAYQAYQLTNNACYFNEITQTLVHIEQQLATQPFQLNSEWIYGQSGLVKLLENLYRKNHLQTAKACLQGLLKNWPLESLATCEFAHGDAGVLYALKSVEWIPNLVSVQMKNYITCLSKRLEAEAKEICKMRFSWCRGSAGLSSVFPLAQEQLFNTMQCNLQTPHLMDSCLCHGLFGVIDALLCFKFSQEILSELKQLALQQDYFLEGIPSLTPIGLFTGLSGVGYQFLRLYAPQKIPSILYLT